MAAKGLLFETDPSSPTTPTIMNIGGAAQTDIAFFDIVTFGSNSKEETAARWERQLLLGLARVESSRCRLWLELAGGAVCRAPVSLSGASPVSGLGCQTPPELRVANLQARRSYAVHGLTHRHCTTARLSK